MSRPGDDDWSYFPVHTLPRGLDIVWCRFPELGVDGPGPKPRPALVRTVSLTEGHVAGYVEVCYGTSRMNSDLHAHDLIIANAAQLNLLGLPQATRFDIDKLVTLPWASEFFEPRPGSKTPIIGRLSDLEIAQLDTLKRIRAASARQKRQSR